MSVVVLIPIASDAVAVCAVTVSALTESADALLHML